MGKFYGFRILDCEITLGQVPKLCRTKENKKKG